MSRNASAGLTRPKLIAGAIALFAVLILATAVIALIGLGRMSGDIDWTAVPGWFWYYRGDPQVRRWLAIGAGASGAFAALVGLAAVLNLRLPLHGAARWATDADAKRAGLMTPTGIVLGEFAGRPLVFGGPEHVLLHAPTRTGKGVGVVIPNLLTWPGSSVVMDVKQENWIATAGYRKGCGQTVHLFDPLDPEGRTSRYNPLGHIDRSDPVETLDELQKIAGMLFPTPDHADPFWTESARTGFIGVGAYVAETPQHPFTLGEIFRQLTQGDPRRRFPETVEARARSDRPLSGPCVSALLDFSSAGENTFASIKQTITSRMALWLNPRVDAATSASDFDLRTLRSAPTSIYLGVSPDNVLRAAPLYSLFFQQLVDLNTRALPDRRAEPLEVLVLLDEFARLGHAGVLARAFAYVAGYGLRLLPVLQSPAQLRAIYGPDIAEEIMANCAVEVVFAPKELKIAQELSDRLGAYTYAGRSFNRPILLGDGRRSVTLTDQKRALLLPQELMALSPDALIVLKAGMPPIKGRKLRYFSDRRLKGRVLPPPDVAPSPLPAFIPTLPDALQPSPAPSDEDWSFEALAQALEAEGAPPLPEIGAEEARVEEWIDAVVDQVMAPALDLERAS